MAFWQWSRTATSNGTSDPTMNWSEGIAPSIVDDNVRALMARAAEFRDDTSGLLVTGGTSTAYTLTTNQGLPTTPNDGQLIVFSPHVTNGASPTLAADGGTAFPLQSSPGTALGATALTALIPYQFKFRSASSAWIQFGSGPATSLNGAATITGSLVDNATSVTFGAGAANAFYAGLNGFAVAGIIMDGAGSVVTSGQHGTIYQPFNAAINAWRIIADQSGSISVDVLRSNFGVPSASIVGSGNIPSLSSQQINQQALSGWTSTTLTRGDFIAFNVTGSPVSVQRVTIVLDLIRTAA